MDIVEAQARKRPANAAILYQDQVMTYAQLDARANRYAHWALAQGIGRGTPVALLMENRPDFICAWLGLFKVGAQVALINTNLVGPALAHSINVSGARHAIVGAELVRNFLDAPFKAPPVLWVEGVDPLDGKRAISPARWRRHAGNIARQGGARRRDPEGPRLLHLHLRHHRHAQGGQFQPYAHAVHDDGLCRRRSGRDETDRIYDPLPLYHSTGGVCAVGLAFLSGGALIIKRKFSVHEFWSDVHAMAPPCSNISANCAAIC